MRTTARNGFRAYEPTITIDPDDHPAFLTLGEIEHLSYNSVIGELAWPSGKTTEVPTRGNLTSPICRTIFGWDNQTFIKVDAISPEEKAARAKARYEEKKDAVKKARDWFINDWQSHVQEFLEYIKDHQTLQNMVHQLTNVEYDYKLEARRVKSLINTRRKHYREEGFEFKSYERCCNCDYTRVCREYNNNTNQSRPCSNFWLRAGIVIRPSGYQKGALKQLVKEVRAQQLYVGSSYRGIRWGKQFCELYRTWQNLGEHFKVPEFKDFITPEVIARLEF